MKRLASLLTLTAIFTIPSQGAGSALVFDQIDPTESRLGAGLVNSGTVSQDGSVGDQIAAADDFVLPFDTYLTHVVFWNLEENDPTGGQAVWSRMLEYAIWQDTGSIAPMPSNEPIGEPGAAGSGLRVSKTLGEQGIEIQGVTYDQYQYSFELEAAVGLSGNTRYWFSIYLGQPTNLTLSTGFLWQQTDASGIAAISPAAIDGSPFLTLDADTLPPATWQSLSPARNLALRFYGERMPVVGTNWLLAPVVMALIAWRQSRGTRKSALA